MNIELNLNPVREAAWRRGFTNLFAKESRAWWSTRRWLINALLWPGMIGSLVGMMLFMLPAVAAASGDPNVEAAGGPLPFSLQMGRTVLFELGGLAFALGAIVLSQDLVVEEKANGVTEWLLARPVARQAYILAKLAASSLAVLTLVVLLPAILAYGLLFLRSGTFEPLFPFLSGVGLVAAHTQFYLTLTLMLGVWFSNRAPILGIGIGLLLGGSMVGSMFPPLLYVTPWILPKAASAVAAGDPLPGAMLAGPLASTVLWCLVFTILALAKFERVEV